MVEELTENEALTHCNDLGYVCGVACLLHMAYSKRQGQVQLGEAEGAGAGPAVPNQPQQGS